MNSRITGEKLRWSLMHHFLFDEASIAPDIFFFISEDLQRLALEDRPEARLFRESIRLGALRPQFRDGARSFTGALRAIESPDAPANRIEGPEIDRPKIAAELDRFLQSFDNWPIGGTSLNDAYVRTKATIDDVLGGIAWSQDSVSHSLSDELKHLWDEAANISLKERHKPDDIRRGDLFRLIAAKTNPVFATSKHLPSRDAILRAAPNDIVRQNTDTLIKMINSLYFMQQADRFESRLARRPDDTVDSELLARVADANDPDRNDASYEPCNLPRLVDLYNLETATLVDIRKSDEAEAYFAKLRRLDTEKADVHKVEECLKCYSDYTRLICKYAMAGANVPAQKLMALFLTARGASIVLDIADSSYRTVEKLGEFPTRTAGAVRYALQRVQLLLLKNIPNLLQKRIERVVREKTPEFFEIADKRGTKISDKSGTRYDQLTVDVRRALMSPVDQQNKRS